MSPSRLIFFPATGHLIFTSQDLTSSLISAEFIEAAPYSDNHYLPGERFLNLITFLGCSPNINLQPTEGEQHCYISFFEETDDINYLGSTKTVNPKCPSCKKRIADWKTENWKKPLAQCICDKCQTETPYADLNWKQECGFARCGFQVSHIYPHEAVPTEQFLEKLKQGSGFEWNYCYAND